VTATEQRTQNTKLSLKLHSQNEKICLHIRCLYESNASDRDLSGTLKSLW